MQNVTKIINILTPQERRRFGWLAVAIVVMGFLEVIGIGSILPFIQLLAAPELVEQNTSLSYAYHLFGFTSVRHMLIYTGLLVIVVLLFSNLFIIFTNWLKLKFSWEFAHQASTRLLGVYFRKPYAFYLNANSAELSSYIVTEVHSITNGILIPCIEIFSRSILSIAIFSLLIWVNPQIAIIMFLFLGGAYSLVYWYQRNFLAELGELRVKTNAKRYRSLIEVFDGIKTVMVYNKLGFFFNHYERASKAFNDLQPQYFITLSAPKNILEILAFGTIVIITIILYGRNENVETILPTLSLYAVAGYRLLPALQSIFSALGKVRHNLPALNKLYDYMVEGRIHGLSHIHQNTVAIPFNQKLTLQNLSFKYEGNEQPTLENVNLTISKGETIAFVGTTGSGKTTLIDLITGILQAQSGQIVVDDTPLTTKNIKQWQAGIAYVPQDIFLFDHSIASNITLELSAENIDWPLMNASTRLADIHDFIQTLPDGFDTGTGEKGVRLSGGQRQRIGIARALYTQPSILVLDEATSALDTLTEQGIVKALNDLPEEITTILIAHRLSTVERADRIYLLEAGRIVAVGTFEELSRSNEVFKQMTLAK
ncbi:MAG: ABC transporter ATP-binding protein [Bacteroidota bacterium]